MDIQNRIQRAAESILGNEAISAGLDDPAARQLLHWGVNLAHYLVATTSEMDDQQAEQALAPALRNLRKLLRLSNHWASKPESDLAVQTELLDQICERVQQVYGESYQLPGHETRQVFLLRTQKTDPANRVAALQYFIEQKHIP